MNKKQLISIIRTEVLLAKSSPERKGYIAGLEEAINIIDGFSDEPQKPVVPQFVADWIEHFKKLATGIYFKRWTTVLKRMKLGNGLMIKTTKKPFALSWLYGYEVEKEKRYLVKLQGIEKEKCYLNYNFGGVWLFYNQENFYGYRAHHTRKELEEAGFGEVFNSPLFEVEEV